MPDGGNGVFRGSLSCFYYRTIDTEIGVSCTEGPTYINPPIPVYVPWVSELAFDSVDLLRDVRPHLLQ